MTRVQAIRVHKTGGPEELRFEEIELGTPGPGAALVRHTAIGLNFTDIHFRTGRYAERSEMLERASELFDVLRSGAVRVTVSARYALADAAQAQRDLEARKTTGSVILVP